MSAATSDYLPPVWSPSRMPGREHEHSPLPRPPTVIGAPPPKVQRRTVSECVASATARCLYETAMRHAATRAAHHAGTRHDGHSMRPHRRSRDASEAREDAGAGDGCAARVAATRIGPMIGRASCVLSPPAGAHQPPRAPTGHPICGGPLWTGHGLPDGYRHSLTHSLAPSPRSALSRVRYRVRLRRDRSTRRSSPEMTV